MSDTYISQEERQRIIQEIENISKFSNFSCDLSDIFLGEEIDCQHKSCSDCQNETIEKLLALIKQAPAQNMRAAELANKFEQNSSISEWSLTYAIAKTLGYDERILPYKAIYKNLIDAIRNLDSAQWPLDRDGVEIKPGDTVYMGENEYTVQYITYDTTGAMVFTGLTDPSVCKPKDFTHSKPRTLEDIINEMQVAFNKDLLRIDLIKEAYEIGKASRNE